MKWVVHFSVFFSTLLYQTSQMSTTTGSMQDDQAGTTTKQMDINITTTMNSTTLTDVNATMFADVNATTLTDEQSTTIDPRVALKANAFDPNANYTSKLVPEVAEDELTDEEICSLPVDPGHCFHTSFRYFFHFDSNACFEFERGSCEGNENSFATIAECESTCLDKTDVDLCRLPKDDAICRQTTPREKWYFQDGECKKMIMDVCGGNQNRFEEEYLCYIKCLMKQGDYCSLPATFGTCTVQEDGYRHENGFCYQFLFSRCGGNANTFLTQEECEATCVHKTEDVCAQPMHFGHCTLLAVRYRYNIMSGKCELYARSACGGNRNDFMTMKMCNKICPRIVELEKATTMATIIKKGKKSHKMKMLALLGRTSEKKSSNKKKSDKKKDKPKEAKKKDEKKKPKKDKKQKKEKKAKNAKSKCKKKGKKDDKKKCSTKKKKSSKKSSKKKRG